jgi:hypothetical protein
MNQPWLDLDKDMEPMNCFKCGTPYPVTVDRIGRTAACPKCDADLHCCRNCRHYSPAAHNACAEPKAEWVREKDRSNFCDYFEPRRGGPGSSGSGDQSQADARARFENLFRKK